MHGNGKMKRSPYASVFSSFHLLVRTRAPAPPLTRASRIVYEGVYFHWDAGGVTRGRDGVEDVDGAMMASVDCSLRGVVNAVEADATVDDDGDGDGDAGVAMDRRASVEMAEAGWSRRTAAASTLIVRSTGRTAFRNLFGLSA